jgi:hypothetical protein
MRVIIVAGLVLTTLAVSVSAAPVDITIRARSDQTPVKSGIWSKDPTKADWWFRDTSDDGDAKLTNYLCADGQVFQARPKRPGYIFDPQDWKICQAGIVPFAYKKVLYSGELQKALITVGRLQSTDDQIALMREIFLKAYDSGDFFALSASSSELEKKLADQKDVSQSLNTMTLESLQRGLGSDKPLNFDPQKKKYELPKEIASKVVKWPVATEGKLNAHVVKSIATENTRVFSIPDALLLVSK